jgi:hypothetical protein
MMRHGILQRVLEMGVPPPPPVRQTSWLLVRCCDRSGLLADVANIISTHAHNILVGACLPAVPPVLSACMAC